MKLTSLQLENFRNYSRHSLEFDPQKNITVLVGPNGKGKTNLLEAIYVLSLGRSFRTLHKDDLLTWDMDYMRCKGAVKSDNESKDLEVFYSNYPRQQRSFKRNEVSMKNSEYLGNLLTVLFHPEDLNMLYLSPSLRRRYLNILLSQTDKYYLQALTNYNKILKQRNSLLFQIRDKRFSRLSTTNLEADLDAWDTEIIEHGSYIIEKRTELTEFLATKLSPIYNSISGTKEKITLKYKSNTKGDYEKRLKSKRETDIKTAKTLIGPHRDDIVFYINSQPIQTSASRGEFRTLLLAIKLAEIQYIKQKTKKNPVLLLDDVFSELDKKRQNQLLKSIKSCQTIITTTDIGNLGELAKESPTTMFVKVE
ncbi:MAG: DNA replication/repair protein RecF [Candidatus Peregrinibacteria bacterium]